MLFRSLLCAIRLCGPRMKALGTKAQECDSAAAGRFDQMLASIVLIQNYTLEARQTAQFDATSAAAREARLRQHGAELQYWLAVTLVFAAVASALIGYGSSRALAGELSVGQLTVFLAYLAQLHEPLNQLAHVGAAFSTASAGADRVIEVLESPEPPQAVVNPALGKPPPAVPTANVEPSSAAIEFRNVSFQYQEDRPVLRRIEFKLNHGEAAALIGPSEIGRAHV